MSREPEPTPASVLQSGSGARWQGVAGGSPGQANYCAAEAGVIGLIKTLAREWGQFKINVNAVAFGLIETRMTVPKTDDSLIDSLGARSRSGSPSRR